MNAVSGLLTGWVVRWLRMFRLIFEDRQELPQCVPVSTSIPREEKNELLPIKQCGRFERNPCFILEDRKVIYISQRGNPRTGLLEAVHGPMAIITRKGSKPFRRTLSPTPLLLA